MFPQLCFDRRMATQEVEVKFISSPGTVDGLLFDSEEECTEQTRKANDAYKKRQVSMVGRLLLSEDIGLIIIHYFLFAGCGGAS